MKSIPNISFKSQDSTAEIEFLKLSELFSRIRNVPHHDPIKPHRLNFFALIIVTEGHGTHQVDLKNYPLRNGSIVKIAKNQVHAFQGNLQYKGYLVAFTEDYVLKNFSRSSIDYISHLYNYHLSAPLVENDLYGASFLNDVLHEVQQENRYVQQEVIAKMLELYLLRLEQQTHSTAIQNSNTAYVSLFMRFKSLVEQSYTSTRNVKDYAELLQISAKHLNQVVRQVTLNTAKSFIDQYVLLEAKRAILLNPASVKEIAYSLGFDELTNFTKFFKKHTGSSPKAFKAAL